MIKLHDAWYQGSLWVWLLWPLSLVFMLVASIRKALYSWNVLGVNRVKIPVIVVGNITVGGNGKTPIVIALANHFADKGLKVGVLSRGYKANARHFPRIVDVSDSAAEVGDEPLLIAKRTSAVVIIDPVRSRGAAALQNDCQCDLIICDDGLQHYALARDVEIAVVDERHLGSGHRLPMGPLREGRNRLRHVDCIIHNVNVSNVELFRFSGVAEFTMSLKADRLINLNNASLSLPAETKDNASATAVAGIGNPQRFFTALKQLGWNLSESIAFSDHAEYQVKDIPEGKVITTEKDAVKLSGIAHDDCWYLPVSAVLPFAFYQLIDAKLNVDKLSKMRN